MSTPAIDGAEKDLGKLPNVIGINFGNAFASIAVISSKGLAECIANEDGERQIAAAISFFGEETYIGNQARPHLVKNAKNTIVGFRNLLGKRFTDLKDSDHITDLSSAPIIEDPDTGLPAYKVKILVPAPVPIGPSTPASSLAPSTLVSRVASPAVSKAPTPRSEPTQQERIVTVPEVTTMFLKSLLVTAEDFLGEKVEGAVMSVPDWFDNTAKDALLECATNAGIKVLQLLEDAGAAAGMIVNAQEVVAQGPELAEDRTTLLIDMGASQLALTLLSISKGLVYTYASSHTKLGGDDIDNRLIAWFAKEFTKKTKIPFVVPAANDADRRSEAKLRLAVELTKRTLSASPGAAACSVESLKDGYDFAGTINRLRFDVEMSTIYARVNSEISALLAQTGKDHIQVDELVFVGGSTALPGLRDAVALKFPEDIRIGAYGEEMSQVLAKGSAYQALLVSSLPSTSENAALVTAFERNNNYVDSVALEKTIGVEFVGGSGTFIALLRAGSTLPIQQTANIEVDASALNGKELGIEFWEAESKVKVEKPPSKEKGGDDKADGEDGAEEEDDEDEEEETRTKVFTRSTLLGSTTLAINEGTEHSTLVVQLLVEKDLSIKAHIWEEDYPDVRASISSTTSS